MRNAAYLVTLFVLVGLVSVLSTSCSDAVEAEESVISGNLTRPLLDGSSATTPVSYANLRIVAVTTGGSTRTIPVEDNGDFTLTVTRNASYALNVLDADAKQFVGSFLFRAGSQVSMVLNVDEDRMVLGRCQFLGSEVWCENGFFDSPTSGGLIQPIDEGLGGRTMYFDPSSANAQLIEVLMGGQTVFFETLANPDNPFNVAVYNRTCRGCEDPLLGTAERAGKEHYLYTQNTYETDTCRANVRFQLICTLEDDGSCDGFLKMDIVSSGSDCSAYPPVHVSEPVQSVATALDSGSCGLPPTCSTDAQCQSGVCMLDTGFCQSAGYDAALHIYHFDVGSGDSTLIVSPSGESILIDGGKTTGGRAIAALIRRLVSRLDYIVVTHFDTDHVGGINPIILGPDASPGQRGKDDDNNNVVDDDSEIGAAGSDDLLPDVALDRGISPSTSTMDSYLRAVGTRRRLAELGEVLDMGDPELEVRVVSVNGQIEGVNPFNPSDENERSVGLHISYGDFNYLILGDLPGSGSRRLELAVASSLADEGPIDVLHAGHHGSSESSQLDFLEAIEPQVAIVSVGDSDTCGAGYNTYGLPTQDTLNNLFDAGVEAIYQTQQGGASFSGSCVLGSNQTTRDYGSMPVSFVYSTIVVEAYPEAFRVSGLTFDDGYSAR